MTIEDQPECIGALQEAGTSVLHERSRPEIRQAQLQNACVGFVFSTNNKPSANANDVQGKSMMVQCLIKR